MAQLRLRIVGEKVIEVGGKPIASTSRQLFGLLLYLGVEHPREVPRAELLHLMYPPRASLGEAAHCLRQSLYRLKSTGAPITLGDGTVRVESRQVSSTVTELLTGSADLRRERLAGSFEILPHYEAPGNPAFAEWVEQLRERLHNALRQLLTRDMDIARRKADWRYLEAISRRILELDPLNESAVLGLAEATARTGSKARAIAILNEYRSELGEEHANLALPASLLEKRIDASRERVSVRREPIPLIGRERELESLLSQWESARRGNAHLLRVTGNKSIGKTRLVEELAASVLLSGTGRVVTFSMSPLDADRPLSLFATLANRLSPLPGAAGCDPTSLQALGTLAGSISIPSSVNPDNTNSTLSNAAVRNAICDLITCVTDERPILVVVDDAEHLDEASAHLLDVVLNRVGDKRLLIVLSGIAEPSSAHRPGTLHLEPLAPDNAQDLWQVLLAAQETRLPEDISRKCLDTAAGNPGHMELLAQQAAHDPEQFLIPVDIVSLTDRRLSQLSPHARCVLEAIVILDDAATPSSVSFLTGLATYDLLTALHALESGDLILKTPSGLRYRSGLIAERVRETSSGTVTSVMEGRAAEYLEKDQSGDRWSPSLAWRIASHWQRAGEPRRARAYMRACWQHAVSIGQPARASSAISEALTMACDPEDRASLLDDLIGSLQASLDLDALLLALNQRRTLSARVHDAPSRIAQLAFDEDEASILKNSHPAAHITTLRAQLESSILDPRRRIRAARLLLMAADGELDFCLASYAMSRCQMLTPDSPHSRLLASHVSLIYHTIFGDSERALLIADDIQLQTRSLERSWYTVMSDRNCAFARQLAGPGPSDYESFERSFAQAIDASMTLSALSYAGSLMSVCIDDGDLSGARSWLNVSEPIAESIDGKDLPIDYLGAQVDLSLLSGDFKKATYYIERMEECAPRYQSKRNRNELFIYGLRVQLFRGNLTAPEDHIGRLLHYHEIGKRFTRHDDHMDVLWEVLNNLGESEKASALLSDYLRHHRRERRPCRYLLRLRTQDDPAWHLAMPSGDVSATKAV